MRLLSLIVLIMSAAVPAACGNYTDGGAECTRLLGEIRNLQVDTNGYDMYRTCYQPHAATRGRPASTTSVWDLLERTLVHKQSERAAVAAWAARSASVASPRENFCPMGVSSKSAYLINRPIRGRVGADGWLIYRR